MNLDNLVSSKTIANLICNDAYSGHGFVPFVGSGLSAASGILMGQEFGNFLAYSIYRVVDGKHNLSRDGWPKYPKDEEVDQVKKWVEAKFEEICSELNCRPNLDHEHLVQSIEFSDGSNSTTRQLWSLQRPLIPLIIRSHNDSTWRVETQTRIFQEQFRGKVEWGVQGESGAFSRTSYGFIVEQAIRSMHDWRSMLQFLSQVEIKGEDGIFLRDEGDPSIIDSFNVHITRDRQINLGHKMLAHLSGPLRIRTVLTTNFDSLIETAFAKLLRPLSVVSVSGKGGLPSPKTVRSKETIVKLHGELSETRADFTLDEEPKEEDKETFAQYIRGEFDSAKQTAPISNHIIVLGFSGQDIRIIQMLKYTLDTRPNAKIYWICHGKHEPERVNKLFGKEYLERVITHQTERPDLFLYELYQHVTLNLPSGGFSYEFTHKVPPESIRSQQDQDFFLDNEMQSVEDPSYGLPPEVIARKNNRNKIATKVGSKIAEFVQSPQKKPQTFEYPKKKPIARIEVDWKKDWQGGRPAKVEIYTSSGSASAMRLAFQSLLSARMHCLWLEMQDYPTPEDLLQDILRIIALRVGSYQLEHVVLYPGTNDKKQLLKHIKELLEFLGVSNGKWALFFYGRSVPGAASGWRNKPWSKTQLDTFHDFLKYFGKCGFHTVYAPMTKNRFESEQEKVQTKTKDLLKSLNLKECNDVPKSFKERFIKARKRKNDKEQEIRKEIEEQLVESNQPQLSPAPHLSLYNALQKEVIERWVAPDSKGLTISDAKYAAERYFSKLRFLYASTLFRQSRHTSAFFSDAVFPCPYKFNRHGMDNDWERSIEVTRWVKQLGSIDVFFYKPGGYSWKYRDMRIGLQNKLEAIPFRSVVKSIFSKLYGKVDPSQTEEDLQEQIDSVKPLSYAIQIRSKSHFEIADWYWKAFNATGHYLPLIESLYHHFECLNHIDFARPISAGFDDGDEPKASVLNYQRNLARTCMLSMIKCLITAKPWIKFWLAGVNGHTMFDFKAISNWFDERQNKLKKTEPFKEWLKELTEAKSMLDAEMELVQASLKSEAGNYVPKPYDQEFVPDIRSDYFLKKYSTMEKTRPELSISSDDSVWRTNFAEGFKEWICDDELGKYFQNGSMPIKQIYQHIDEYYKAGNESECGREIGLLKAQWVSGNLRTVECSVCEKPLVEGHRCTNRACGEKPKVSYGFDNSAAVFVVDLLSSLAYLYAKRAKIELYANPDDQNIHRRWVQVTMVCSIALDLCRHVHPAFLKTERKQQIKLRTIYGLALGYLGRPLEANRRFNEASAILSKESRTPDEVETAIIRLRRAETTLLRSEIASDVLNSLPLLSSKDALAQFKCERTTNSDRPTSAISDGIKEWETESSKVKIDEYVTLVEKNLSDRRKCQYSLNEKAITNGESVNADPIIRKIIANWKREFGPGNVTSKAADELFLRLSRMQSAFLDDAWVYLESAERLLAGYSQSSLWWGRVAALKLRAYALVRSDAKFESLVFRRRLQHDTVITDLGARLILIAPTSNFAQMKSVTLLTSAMKAISEQQFIQNTPFTKESRKDLAKGLTRSLKGILQNWVNDEDKQDGTGVKAKEVPDLLLQIWIRAARKLFEVFGDNDGKFFGVSNPDNESIRHFSDCVLGPVNQNAQTRTDQHKYVVEISPELIPMLAKLSPNELVLRCLQFAFHFRSI